jgi:hypothetical protein
MQHQMVKQRKERKYPPEQLAHAFQVRLEAIRLANIKGVQLRLPQINTEVDTLLKAFFIYCSHQYDDSPGN